jgi:delta14-sterol reductase
MDIISDGFGFMLAVGDLLWVPFVYSLQARYLAFRPKDLGYAWSAAILAVNFLGYYIFRAANNEKNEFRNGRNPKSACLAKLCLHRVRADFRDDVTYRRSLVYDDRAGIQATHLRLVGCLPPPKLSVRCVTSPFASSFSSSSRGDLLMALAWSLPTGFDTPVTYFYVVYFAVLLIHRQRRDDEKCEKKYAPVLDPPLSAGLI